MPSIRVGDADIYYESHGEGEPVVWIMGLGLDSRMMLMFTAAFPQYRNIVIDNRGTGRSSVPPGPYSMDQMSVDVLAVMDDLGVEQVRVIGMSLGGAIAQHVAVAAPNRIRSLTLCCTWAGPNEWIRRLNELALLEAEAVGYDAILKHTLLLLFSPKFVIERPEMVQMFEDMGKQMVAPMEPFFSQIEAAMSHDVREPLASLRVPTLIMAGRRDTFVPPELSEELQKLIPGSTLKVYEGGHAFMLEDAAAFNADLTAWLAE
ncbi:MAG TPA: alpha/beta fold hydrolase [Actinomycetota bacterium]